MVRYFAKVTQIEMVTVGMASSSDVYTSVYFPLSHALHWPLASLCELYQVLLQVKGVALQRIPVHSGRMSRSFKLKPSIW